MYFAHVPHTVGRHRFSRGAVPRTKTEHVADGDVALSVPLLSPIDAPIDLKITLQVYRLIGTIRYAISLHVVV